MRGRWIRYSDKELAWLEQHSALVIGEYHRRFIARFGREDVAPTHLQALRKRKGWATGRTGRFEKGQPGWNKGKRCPEGVGGRHPNARRTQFRPGQLSGKAALNRKPVGTERISKDGYRERKIHDGLPFQSRWRAVHLLNGEALHGPLPPGQALKCLDGDKQNTDPANWLAVPRALLPRLNGRHGRNFDAAPAELKPLILAIAQLEHGAREARKRKAA